MPVHDRLALGRLAQEMGFVRDTFEKMCRLAEVLRFIGEDRELDLILALKGGTAINLTIFNLPRLSVDIDLDFVGNLTREETSAKRQRIDELIGRHMAGDGYSLNAKSQQTHALDSLVYSYVNAAGNPDTIKVEINYVLRCHPLPVAPARIRIGQAFTEFQIRTLSPIEIFASKIVALAGLGAARDLYDLNNMACFGLFGESDLILLRKCAVFYLAVAGKIAASGFSLERLSGITQHKVKTDLYPMIRKSERFDLQAAQKRISAFMDEHMSLSDNEAAFLRRFAEGCYEPVLLFDDEIIIKRIENHPMAAWRIRHHQKESN